MFLSLENASVDDINHQIKSEKHESFQNLSKEIASPGINNKKKYKMTKAKRNKILMDFFKRIERKRGARLNLKSINVKMEDGNRKDNYIAENTNTEVITINNSKSIQFTTYLYNLWSMLLESVTAIIKKEPLLLTDFLKIVGNFCRKIVKSILLVDKMTITESWSMGIIYSDFNAFEFIVSFCATTAVLKISGRLWNALIDYAN